MATESDPKSGICTNSAGCTLAYSKQVQTVTGPFVCQECGQALQPAADKPLPGKSLLWVGVAALCVVFIGGGVIVFSKRSHPLLIKTTQSDKPAPVSTPADIVATPSPEPVAESVSKTTAPAPAEKEPKAEPAPVPPPVTMAATPRPEPVSTPQAPVVPPPVVSAASPVTGSETETREVKAEVLKRIEIMPDLTPDKRNKLYQSVERAKSMTKIAVIPFEAGRTTVAPQTITDLVGRLRAPELKSILDDPTAVFVILGYADKKGDEQKNLQISRARAENAMKALQNQGKVLNVLRPVGMGSSNLFDTQQLGKNRLVEVWVVQM